MSKIKVGIIGGSGLNNPDILQDGQERRVQTPFGEPSDVLIEGTISGVSCVLLARHGRNHTIPPTAVPFRANVWALKEAGCTHILASTACGGLKEETAPGTFVVLDQFIDRTTKRELTFYDGKPGHPCQGVMHMPMAHPFCEKTRKVMMKACEKVGVQFFRKGTIVVIEGPRFSTRAEALMFRQWGADVISMSAVPEVQLAKEAGLSYSSIAMVTDYDCWRSEEESVSVEGVLETFKSNVEKIKKVLLNAIELLAEEDWTETIAANQAVVRNNNFSTLKSGSS